MLQWILMAAMTAAAALAVLVPIGRRSAAAEGSARSIYRDQLDELARDRERGLIGDTEAEAARVELSRRLLKADGAAGVPGDADGRRAARIGFVAAAILVPVVALGLYLRIGSPALPDLPLAARETTAAQDAEISMLIGRIEQHLKDAPEDGNGWELLAPVYAKLGRYDDAVRAWGNAIRLLGSSADREGRLGEALTARDGGMVSADAKAAFARALALDPKDERAGFYSAVAITQSGDRPAAIAAWRALIDGAKGDPAWLPVARSELAELENPQKGPTATDMQAAAGKSPGEQQAMIEGMVGSLAARLDAAPDDAEGWARLFRAYIVLGRPADAKAALVRARAALAAKPELLAAVEKAAAETGVAVGEP